MEKRFDLPYDGDKTKNTEKNEQHEKTMNNTDGKNKTT